MRTRSLEFLMTQRSRGTPGDPPGAEGDPLAPVLPTLSLSQPPLALPSAEAPFAPQSRPSFVATKTAGSDGQILPPPPAWPSGADASLGAAPASPSRAYGASADVAHAALFTEGDAPLGPLDASGPRSDADLPGATGGPSFAIEGARPSPSSGRAPASQVDASAVPPTAHPAPVPSASAPLVTQSAPAPTPAGQTNAVVKPAAVISNDTVSYAGSKITFSNSYSSTVSAAYHNCVIEAEQSIIANLTCSFDITINESFNFGPVSGQNLANNTDGNAYVEVSYASLVTELSFRATSEDDKIAVANLPATDPSGGQSFVLPGAYAQMLGFTLPESNIDNVTLSNGYAWSYGQDVIATLEHEITENGMGRIGALALNPQGSFLNSNGSVASTFWGPMDLFRYQSDGKTRDYTGGKDGVTTYFSIGDGKISPDNLNNPLDPNDNNNNKGDLADYAHKTSSAFGIGNAGSNATFRYLTPTDLETMDVLGWTVISEQWNIKGSGSWFTASDWTAAVPIYGSNVTIDQGAPIVSGNAGEIFSLAIGAAGALTFSGSSSLTVTTTLDNEGSLTIGAGGALTVLQGYSGSGGVSLTGSASQYATLTSGGSAGFGQTGVIAGSVSLSGLASLVFASGEITTISLGGSLSLDGGVAQISDSGVAGNSALTGLTSNNGDLVLADGAALKLSGGLTNSGVGFVSLDAASGSRGSVLAIGGTLNNAGGIVVGNAGAAFEPASLSAASLVNSGSIALIGANEGSPIAALTVTQSVQNSGSLTLSRDAELQASGNVVNSGTIALDTSTTAGGSLLSVGGTLTNSKTVQIGDATATNNQPTDQAGRAALAALVNQSGAAFDLYNGAETTVSGYVTNAGAFAIDANNSYNDGSLSVAGLFTNSGSAQIGDAQSAGLDTLTAGALANSGALKLIGYRGTAYVASLAVTGSAINSGAIALISEAQAHIAGNLLNTGSIALDASSSSGGASFTVGGTLTNDGTVTVGATTNTGLGGGDLLTLGALIDAAGATITLKGSAPRTTTLTVAGATTDSGAINATDSDIVLTGAVTGAGTIGLGGGDELELGGADSAGIALTGSNNLIKIDAPGAGVTGTIAGLALGDVIDLVGIAAAGATLNQARTLLTVNETNGKTLSYTVSGLSPSAGVEVKSDGAGGTDLAVVPQFNWANAVSGTWATAADWTPSGTPVLGDIAELAATGPAYTVTAAANAAADVLGLAAGATLAIASGATFTIGAGLTNAGTIALLALGKTAALDIATGIPVSLTGGGHIKLSDNANNLIDSTVQGSLLDNVDNVISGAGAIGSNAAPLSFDNEAKGVVTASGANPLAVTGASIVNNGLMQATSSGGLRISGSVTGAGKILATGANAHVDLDGATVSAGTLAATAGGAIDVVGSLNTVSVIGSANGTGGATTTLTLSGPLQVTANGNLGLIGAIVDAGSIAVAAGGQVFMSGAATLSGGGAISVASGATISLAGLDNVDNAITVAGTLATTSKKTAGTFTNGAKGVVTVTSATRSTMANIVNAGLIEDTGAGGILLQGSIADAGGTIEAVGANAHVDLSIADIVGGTLNTLSGGVIETTGSLNELDGSTSVVTNLGALQISQGTALAGTLDNAGAIALNDAELTLLYSQTARLTGSGTIAATSGSSFGATVNLHGTLLTTLDNVGNTISGATTFYDTLINEAAAVIDATGLMSFSGSFVNVTNAGLMEATGSGELSFADDVITNTGVIEAVGADAEISMVDLTLRGGTLRTTGGAKIATDSSFYLDGATAGALTLDITQSLSVYSLTGSLSFANDGSLSFVSPQSKPRTAISLGATQRLFKTGGAGISQVALNGNIFANSGSVGATSGELLIVDGTLSGGGTISASGTGSVDLYQDDLQGGALKLSGTGTFTVQGTSTWDGSTSAGAVNNQAYVSVAASSSLSLLGTINNTGTVIASSGVTLASSSVALTGAGLLTLIDADIADSATGTVFSNSNTIYEENGVIGAGVGVDLQNAGVINLFNGEIWLDHLYDPSHTVALPQSVNTGVIEAIDGTTSIIESAPVQNGQFDFPISTLTNSGTLEAAASSTLAIGAGLTNFSSSVSGEIVGGVYEANGANSTLSLTGGIVVDAATLILSGSGSEIEGASNATLETTLTTVAAAGSLEVLGARSYATANAFTLAGSTQGAAGGVLQLGGGEFYASAFSAGAGSTLIGFGVVAARSGTESGTVHAVGGTLAFNGVSMAFSGAFTGSATVAFDGASSVTLNSGATFAVSGLMVADSGTAVELAETATFAGAFSLGAGASVSIDAGDTFTLTGKSTIAGEIGGGTLALAGGGSTLLKSGASFFSSTDIALSGAGTSLEAAENVTVSQGGFNEGAGASITVDSGDTLTLSAPTTLAGTVAGAGTLALGGGAADLLASGATLGMADLTLSDSGTTLEIAGTTAFSGGFASASGTAVTVDAGDSFTLAGQSTIGGVLVAGSGATAALKGAVTVTGELEAGPGGAVTFAASASLTNDVGGTLTGGAFEADQGGVLSLTGGPIVTDAASITLQRSGAVLQAGVGGSFTSLLQSLTTIAAGGSLTISGGAYSFAHAIALNGTLDVVTPPLAGSSAGTFTSGLVTASATSKIESTFGKGTIASSLTDAGTVYVGSLSSLAFTGAQDTFSGAFQSSASALDEIDFAAGADTLAAGASFANSNTVFDGAAVTLGANVSDAGNFTMSGGTLALAGNVFTVAGTATLAGGALSGSGSLTLDGATTLSAFTVSGGSTLANAGALTETGSLTLGGAGGLKGNVLNTAGDTFTLTGSGAGTSAIGVAIANSGTISATKGLLDLQGAVTGTGALSVQGASTLEFDAAVGSTQAFSFADDLGTLMLKDSSAFGAKISGFTAGDVLDFADFGLSGSTLAFSPASGAGLGGALTLTNGAHTATLTLTGSPYSATGFSLVSDGHGGAEALYAAPT